MSVLDQPEVLDWYLNEGTRKRKKRTTATHASNFWEEVVPVSSDSNFVDDFRMSRSLFSWLVLQLSPLLEMDPLRCGAPIAVDKTVAMVLYRWAAGTSLRVTARTFGVEIATVHIACRRVADAIIETLYHRIIRFPATDDLDSWREIQSVFAAKQGIENVSGAIDGTHFALRKPPGDSLNNAYINRKG